MSSGEVGVPVALLATEDVRLEGANRSQELGSITAGTREECGALWTQPGRDATQWRVARNVY